MTLIKVGLIGFGAIAKEHLNQLLRFSNVCVKAIYSRTDKKDVIPKGINFYTDYNKMLDSEPLNAILICTPTYTHKEITCKCAEYDLDIFLEKPMALNVEECNTIIDSIHENNIRILLGHVLRFWPSYGSIHHYLEQKKLNLGDFVYFEGKRLATFPWSRWFADQKKSGGVILDLSIHDIDFVLWSWGIPQSVACKAQKIVKYGMDVFGESTTRLNFSNDSHATCEASWAKPENFQFYTYAKLMGTQNSIEFDGSSIFNNDKFQIENIFESDSGYYNLMAHFIDVVKDKKKRFKISENDGLLAVKTCYTALKSAEQKGKEIFLEEIE